MKLDRTMLVTLGLCATLGCGGSSSSPAAPTPAPTPAPAQRAAVTLTNSPDPIIATASGNPSFPWTATWEVVIRESAGLGGNVDFINVGLRNLAGFESPSVSNWGADRIITRAGTNHFAAGGTLRIPLSTTYTSGNVGGSRTIDLIVTAQIHDDRGNLITATSEVRVLLEDAVRLE